ncbi:hypothetical protein BHE90_004568 [Fusarium euwallaceae]|uniref:Uncharacterized protein n=1 Tax=Fusarium euwallaceae TaxID=1147111 RepID=A0A430LZ16_9HYPO|nr:hypothetical protein BHE90_004568 [Fusarium euwallaceae]
MLFGRVDREILAADFVLYYTFVAGSMMLGISIGLNAVSMHGTCTAVFIAVTAIVGGSFASIRTLGKMSWLALVGVTSLVIANKRKRDLKWFLVVIWSGFVVVSGTFLLVAGTYGSVITIVDSYKKDGGSNA